MADLTMGDECVQLSPAQSNEILLEKLTHLEPVFGRFLGELKQLKEDLSNGIIHWDEIFKEARRFTS
jgi:hypothetical protein